MPAILSPEQERRYELSPTELVSHARGNEAVVPEVAANSGEVSSSLETARKTIRETQKQREFEKEAFGSPQENLLSRIDSILQNSNQTPDQSEIFALRQQLDTLGKPGQKSVRLLVQEHLTKSLESQIDSFLVETASERQDQPWATRLFRNVFAQEKFSRFQDKPDVGYERVSGNSFLARTANVGISLVEKFRNWIRTKSAARSVVGYGLLTGAGFSIAVGNIPVAAGLLMTRAGMAGAGAYITAEQSMTRNAIHARTSTEGSRGVWDRFKGLFTRSHLGLRDSELTSIQQEPARGQVGEAGFRIGETVQTLAAADGSLETGLQQHESFNELVAIEARRWTNDFLAAIDTQTFDNKRLAELITGHARSLQLSFQARLESGQLDATGDQRMRHLKAGVVGAVAASISSFFGIRRFGDAFQSAFEHASPTELESVVVSANEFTPSYDVVDGPEVVQPGYEIDSADAMDSSLGIASAEQMEALKGQADYNYQVFSQLIQPLLSKAANEGGTVTDLYRAIAVLQDEGVQLNIDGELVQFAGYDFQRAGLGTYLLTHPDVLEDPDKLYSLLSIQDEDRLLAAMADLDTSDDLYWEDFNERAYEYSFTNDQAESFDAGSMAPEVSEVSVSAEAGYDTGFVQASYDPQPPAPNTGYDYNYNYGNRYEAPVYESYTQSAAELESFVSTAPDAVVYPTPAEVPVEPSIEVSDGSLEDTIGMVPEAVQAAPEASDGISSDGGTTEVSDSSEVEEELVTDSLLGPIKNAGDLDSAQLREVTKAIARSENFAGRVYNKSDLDGVKLAAERLLLGDEGIDVSAVRRVSDGVMQFETELNGSIVKIQMTEDGTVVGGGVTQGFGTESVAAAPQVIDPIPASDAPALVQSPQPVSTPAYEPVVEPVIDEAPAALPATVPVETEVPDAPVTESDLSPALPKTKPFESGVDREAGTPAPETQRAPAEDVAKDDLLLRDHPGTALPSTVR